MGIYIYGYTYGYVYLHYSPPLRCLHTHNTHTQQTNTCRLLPELTSLALLRVRSDEALPGSQHDTVTSPIRPAVQGGASNTGDANVGDEVRTITHARAKFCACQIDNACLITHVVRMYNACCTHIYRVEGGWRNGTSTRSPF